MESAELLDLLGNETRRRILALLAQKPRYVTEISELTGVSPKAVIDHLDRLERAGLIEYRHSNDRRKYFSIVQSQRLEITIGPHQFGTTNGYLPPRTVGDHQFNRIDVNLDPPDDPEDLTQLLETLDALHEAASELSRAQRCVHGEIDRLYGHLIESVFDGGSTRLDVDVLRALTATGPAAVEEVAKEASAEPARVERALRRLATDGLAERTALGWVVAR
ncbi:MAG: ArsR family transcriptional regulator [Halobacteriales archaeon]